MTEYSDVKIPVPIIEMIKKILNMQSIDTTGYHSVEEYVTEALLQDISATLEPHLPRDALNKIDEQLRQQIT